MRGGEGPRSAHLTEPLTSRDLFGVARGACTEVGTLRRWAEGRSKLGRRQALADRAVPGPCCPVAVHFVRQIHQGHRRLQRAAWRAGKRHPAAATAAATACPPSAARPTVHQPFRSAWPLLPTPQQGRIHPDNDPGITRCSRCGCPAEAHAVAEHDQVNCPPHPATPLPARLDAASAITPASALHNHRSGSWATMRLRWGGGMRRLPGTAARSTCAPPTRCCSATARQRTWPKGGELRVAEMGGDAIAALHHQQRKATGSCSAPLPAAAAAAGRSRRCETQSTRCRCALTGRKPGDARGRRCCSWGERQRRWRHMAAHCS